MIILPGELASFLQASPPLRSCNVYTRHYDHNDEKSLTTRNLNHQNAINYPFIFYFGA